MRSRNALPCVKIPLHGYVRAKIPSGRLLRDEMHSRIFASTVYEIFRLVGEVIGICGPGTSGPLNGNAHLRPDGVAHLGMVYHIGGGPGCPPAFVHGTLNPPSFNSGSGFLWFLNGPNEPVGFSPAACPPLPQMVE